MTFQFNLPGTSEFENDEMTRDLSLAGSFGTMNRAAVGGCTFSYAEIGQSE